MSYLSKEFKRISTRILSRFLAKLQLFNDEIYLSNLRVKDNLYIQCSVYSASTSKVASGCCVDTLQLYTVHSPRPSQHPTLPGPGAMKRGFRPNFEPSGQEGMPLVGMRPSNGGLLRTGSCIGDPKVRMFEESD